MKTFLRKLVCTRLLHCFPAIATCIVLSSLSLRAEDEHFHDSNGHDHASHADEEMSVEVTKEQVERFGIKIATASKGTVDKEIKVSGEISFNEDRIVHMVPRVSGIASKVLKSIGDRVNNGDELAIIESRELADAKSEYVSAKARSALFEKIFAREKSLYEKKISSEEEYIKAELSSAEAAINLRAARQKLHALGLSNAYIEGIDQELDGSLMRYSVRSPISGVVVQRHISPGESLQADTGIFTIADLSSVWVDLAVSQETIPLISKGLKASIRLPGGSEVETEIAFIAPVIDPETRTAIARAVLENSKGQFRPGTFIEAVIRIPSSEESVVVPHGSIQLVNDHPCVFVWESGRFKLREVKRGSSDGEMVEIVSGLHPGERVAAVNAFHLKAEYIKSASGDLGAHHGHSH